MYVSYTVHMWHIPKRKDNTTVKYCRARGPCRNFQKERWEIFQANQRFASPKEQRPMQYALIDRTTLQAPILNNDDNTLHVHKHGCTYQSFYCVFKSRLPIKPLSHWLMPSIYSPSREHTPKKKVPHVKLERCIVESSSSFTSWVQRKKNKNKNVCVALVVAKAYSNNAKKTHKNIA